MNITGVSNNVVAGLNKTQASTDNKIDFKEMINNEIEKLNNTQIQADRLTQDLISGEIDDLHTVLIATEEARLALELAVQVRNKAIEAYKEINNMQL